VTVSVNGARTNGFRVEGDVVTVLAPALVAGDAVEIGYGTLATCH
jgi:hypothetical protein